VPEGEEPPLRLAEVRKSGAAALRSGAGVGPFLEGVKADLLVGCALDGAGQNAYAAAMYPEAWRLHARAYALGAKLDGADAAVLKSRALDGMGRVSRERGQSGLAYRLHVAACDVALAVMSEATALRPVPTTCVANALSNAGVVRFRQKRWEEAGELHSVALSLREISGDIRGCASCVSNMAFISSPIDALPLYRRSHEMRKQIGDVWGVAGSLRCLSDTHRKLGETREAKDCIANALPKFAQVNDPLGIAECLESLGFIIFGDGDSPESAAKFLGAAIGMRNSIHAGVDVVMKHSEASHLKAVYAEAWAQGERLSREDAVALGVSTMSSF